MKWLWSFFLICGLMPLSYGQLFTVEKLIEVNPEYPDEVYEFPLLTSPNKMVASKVNMHLIKQQLDIDYGHQKTSIFENVWRSGDMPMASIGYLTYKTELLSRRLYSVTLSGEWCSAYCEGFENTYTFDLDSGIPVTLDTFFTKSGQVKLLNQIVSFKKGMISKKIESLKIILGNDTLTEEESTSLSEVIELYENCGTQFDSLHYIRFIPSGTSIKVIADRCSLHHNRALDDLWYFNYNIELNAWQKDLSAYGRKLFMD
jgi:hypothetical protein